MKENDRIGVGKQRIESIGNFTVVVVWVGIGNSWELSYRILQRKLKIPLLRATRELPYLILFPHRFHPLILLELLLPAHPLISLKLLLSASMASSSRTRSEGDAASSSDKRSRGAAS